MGERGSKVSGVRAGRVDVVVSRAGRPAAQARPAWGSRRKAAQSGGIFLINLNSCSQSSHCSGCWGARWSRGGRAVAAKRGARGKPEAPARTGLASRYRWTRSRKRWRSVGAGAKPPRAGEPSAPTQTRPSPPPTSPSCTSPTRGSYALATAAARRRPSASLSLFRKLVSVPPRN